MERFYGFDLGDAESAVARLKKEDPDAPEILEVGGAKSFVTAYALLPEGQLLIGEPACYHPDASVRQVRFKSRFLTGGSAAKDVRSFAGGVLGELYVSGGLIRGEDNCFYIGCPAGWDAETRERYREIFEQIGYPPARIVSESRAALVAACQSRHLQVGYDILARPVLVVDIGSSTTDFAYVCGGKEIALRTGGEVFLGGGVMDELLLEESVAASREEKRIREIFAESEAWRSYCEFAARRLKEKYFADEEYWREHDCAQTISIRYRKLPVRLTLRVNAEIAEHLIGKKIERLENRSFREVFLQSLRQAREGILGEREASGGQGGTRAGKDVRVLPELIFLTGGVSRLGPVKDWCREVFPEAVIVTSREPEFSVASGLTYCGRIDEEVREFRREVENLIDSTVVERIVGERIDDLYRDTVDAMVDPILENAALPVIERWRSGAIERLSEIDGELEREIDAYLRSGEARALLAKPVAAWMKPVAYALEEQTIPICVRHNIPYSALSLSSYLALSDIEVKVDSRDIFAVEGITWMIDAIVSVLVGLLCGGGGVALLAGGPEGVIAGAALSLIVLVLGKDKMQNALLNAKLPKATRRLLPKGYFESRLAHVGKEVKAELYEKLGSEKNEEISERLVRDISVQIERCLMRMAEVIEVPLG